MANSTDDKQKLLAALGKKTSASTGTKSTGSTSEILKRMRNASLDQESDGDYKAENKRTKAAGGFQVMPANVPDWTYRHVGRRMTVEEFKNDPVAQEKVFHGEMGIYLNEALKKSGGDEDKAIRMAAAAWYGGQRAMHRYDDPVRFRADEPSFKEYTESVLNKSKNGNSQITSAPKTPDLKNFKPANPADLLTKLSSLQSPQNDVQEKNDAEPLQPSLPTAKNAVQPTLNPSATLPANTIPESRLPAFNSAGDQETSSGQTKSQLARPKPKTKKPRIDSIPANGKKINPRSLAPNGFETPNAKFAPDAPDVPEQIEGINPSPPPSQSTNPQDLLNKLAQPNSANPTVPTVPGQPGTSGTTSPIPEGNVFDLKAAEIPPALPPQTANVAKDVPPPVVPVKGAPVITDEMAKNPAMDELSKKMLAGEIIPNGKPSVGQTILKKPGVKKAAPQPVAPLAPEGEPIKNELTPEMIAAAENEFNNSATAQKLNSELADYQKSLLGAGESVDQPAQVEERPITSETLREAASSNRFYQAGVNVGAVDLSNIQAAKEQLFIQGLINKQVSPADAQNLLRAFKSDPKRSQLFNFSDQEIAEEIKFWQEKGEPMPILFRASDLLEAAGMRRETQAADDESAARGRRLEHYKSPENRTFLESVEDRAKSLFGYEADSAEERLDEKIKQHGSALADEQHQAEFDSMNNLEYGVRLGGEAARTVGNMAASSARFVSSLEDDFANKVRQITGYEGDADLSLVNGLQAVIDAGTGAKDDSNLQRTKDDPTKRLFYVMGDSLEKSLGQDKKLRDSFLRSATNAGASAASFFVAGVLGGPVLVGALGMMSEGGSTYKEAVDAGVSANKRQLAAAGGAALGLTELAGLGRVGAALSGETKRELIRSMAQFVGKSGRKAAANTLEEGVQEWVQSGGGDAWIKYVKDNNPSEYQKLLSLVKDIPRAAAANADEALLGALFGATMGGPSAIAETAQGAARSNQLANNIRARNIDLSPETTNVLRGLAKAGLGNGFDLDGVMYYTAKESPEKFAETVMDSTKGEQVAAEAQSQVDELKTKGYVREEEQDGETIYFVTDKGQKALGLNDTANNTADVQSDVQLTGPEEKPANSGGLRRKIASIVDPTFPKEVETERRRADDAAKTAFTDALTGIQNRTAYDKALPRAESDPDTSVIFFDANNFGKINKMPEHSTEAGDKALVNIADSLKKAAEENGVDARNVFRRGGDEFVILAPKAKAEAIRAKAEELYGEIEYSGSINGKTESVKVSISGATGATEKEADALIQDAKNIRKGLKNPVAVPLEGKDGATTGKLEMPEEIPGAPTTGKLVMPDGAPAAVADSSVSNEKQKTAPLPAPGKKGAKMGLKKKAENGKADVQVLPDNDSNSADKAQSETPVVAGENGKIEASITDNGTAPNDGEKVYDPKEHHSRIGPKSPLVEDANEPLRMFDSFIAGGKLYQFNRIDENGNVDFDLKAHDPYTHRKGQRAVSPEMFKKRFGFSISDDWKNYRGKKDKSAENEPAPARVKNGYQKTVKFSADDKIIKNPPSVLIGFDVVKSENDKTTINQEKVTPVADELDARKIPTSDQMRDLIRKAYEQGFAFTDTHKGNVAWVDNELKILDLDALYPLDSATGQRYKTADDLINEFNKSDAAGYRESGELKTPEKTPAPTEEKEKVNSIDNFGTLENPNIQKISEEIALYFSGNGFKTINEARAFVGKLLNVKSVKPGSAAAKMVDEAVEAGMVRYAKTIIAGMRESGASDAEIFSELVDFYNNRFPTMGVRSSTSIKEQAYSTPLPLAFVAQILGGIDEKTSTYEPTGGNGALVINTGNAENVIANELNPFRAANFKSIFPTAIVRVGDALNYEPADPVERVIANPPFGVVKGDDGKSKIFQVRSDYRTTEIDHAIAFKALDSMKDNGRAVLIVGSVIPTETAARSDAYNGKNKRAFYYNLYGEYNVVDHFTVDGDLYRKQGASYPVDVIVIDGRGKSERRLPAADVPRIITSWDELGKELIDGDSNAAKGKSKSADGSTGVSILDAGTAGNVNLRGNAGTGANPGDGEISRGPTDIPAGIQQPSGGKGSRTDTKRAESGRSDSAASTNDVRQGLAGNSNDVGLRGLGTSGQLSDSGQRVSSQPLVEARNNGSNQQLRDAGELGGSETDLRQNDVSAIPERSLGIGGNKRGTVNAEDVAFLDELADEKFGDLPKKSPANSEKTEETKPAEKPAEKPEDIKRRLADKFNQRFAKSERARDDFAPDENFDDSFYEEIKPDLISIAEAVPNARENVKDLMRKLINDLVDNFGLTREGYEAAKKYISQFVADVRDGVIDLINRAADKITQTGEKIAEKVAPKEKEKFEEGRLQVTYTPKSKARPMDTLVPTNMATAVEESLTEFETRNGAVNEFVARELGYDVSEISKYFGAEQLDAIALALDNIKRGAGFIIGDQTGIGKGRVVAAVLRYALKNGKTPIFVTEKPNLYKDIYRDLTDIGITDVKPVMTNGDERVPLNEKAGIELYNNSVARHNALLQGMIDRGELFDPETDTRYNIIFSTYNQMQTVDGKSTVRQDFLHHFADGGIIVFDESHNAGGNPQKNQSNGGFAMDRAQLARALAERADGVMFSSATYAKRADVMDLYAKTDIRKAVPQLSRLPEIVKEGGVPLQQIIAAMLVRAGQYIRRERNFAGIDYDTVPIEVDTKSAEQVSASFMAIKRLDDAAKAAIKKIGQEIKSEAKALSRDGSTGEAGAQSTNFTSLLHNLIDQMLLSLKMDATIDETVKALERDEKPVITVAFTLGSFIEKFVTENDLNPGDAIAANFGDMLFRYLERARMYKTKSPSGQKSDWLYLTDEELGEQGVMLYEKAKNIIRNTDWSKMPASPIDHLKQSLQEKGYRVGEITGRQHTVDYSDVVTAEEIANIEVFRDLREPSEKVLTKAKNSELYTKFREAKIASGIETYSESMPEQFRSFKGELWDIQNELKKFPEADVREQLLTEAYRIANEAKISLGAEAGSYFRNAASKMRSIKEVKGAQPRYKLRPQKEIGIAGRIEVLNAFIGGEIDGDPVDEPIDIIILNQAGSTGLSLHASEKFRDQRRRHMIVAQAERNIDTHMQILGRINRTGQVEKKPDGSSNLPRYSQLTANVPAELRPAAVLAKKMASLNANTTANRGSAVTAKDVVDFLNDYGDEVVAKIMDDYQEIHDKLGQPLDRDESGQGFKTEDAARKVTGRIPLLSLKEQEEIYEVIINEYNDFLAQKEALGENALEAKTLDLDAKFLATKEISPGDAGDKSPFAEAAFAVTADVKRLGRPYTRNQVLEIISKNIVKANPNYKEEDLKTSDFSALKETGKKITNSLLVDGILRFKRFTEEKLDEIEEERMREAQKLRYDSMERAFTRFMENFPIGSTVRIATDSGVTYGVILNVAQRGKPANPLALSSWKVDLATTDSGRHLPTSIGRIEPSFGSDHDAIATNAASFINKILMTDAEDIRRQNRETGKEEYIPIMDYFDLSQELKRETRTILTGNIVKAFEKFKGGRIINFTDDGGEIRQGVLMKQDFDLEKELDNKDVVFSNNDQVIEFLSKATKNALLHIGPDQQLTLQHDALRNEYIFQAPKSKSKGGLYSSDQQIIAAAGTDFYSASQKMTLRINEQSARAVLDVLRRKEYLISAKTHKGEARRIVGAPDREADAETPQFPKFSAAARTRDSENRLDNLHKDDLDNVVGRAAAENKGNGEVYVNEDSAELLRRAVEEYELKVGIIKDGALINPVEGIHLSKNDLAEVLPVWRDTYDQAISPEYGFTAAEFAGLKNLIETVERAAAESGDGSAIIYHFDDVLGEERAHRERGRATENKSVEIIHSPKNIRNMMSSTAMLMAEPKLRRDYPNASDAQLVDELWAKLAGGQRPKYNVSERDADEFILDWLDSLEEKNGVGSIEKMDLRQLSQEFDYAKRRNQRARERKTTAQDENSDDGSADEDDRGDGKPPQGNSGSGLLGNENAAASSGSGFDSDDKTAPEKGNAAKIGFDRSAETNRAFTRETIPSAEEAGKIPENSITGDDRKYLRKSRQKAAEIARERIERDGLGIAIADAKTLGVEKPSAELTALRMETINILAAQAMEADERGDSERAKAKFSEAAEIVLAIAPEHTSYGQAISQLAQWTAKNPEMTAAYVMKERAKNKYSDELTVEEAKELREQARRLVELEKQYEQAQREIRELKAAADGRRYTKGTRNRSTAQAALKKIKPLEADLIQKAKEALEGLKKFSTSQRDRNENDSFASRSQRAPRLDKETVNAIASVGAIKILQGLTDPAARYGKAQFEREMFKEFGAEIAPHLTRIHAASNNLRRKLQRQAAMQEAINKLRDEEIDGEFVYRDLTDEELIDEIKARRADSAELRRVRREHDKASSFQNNLDAPNAARRAKTRRIKNRNRRTAFEFINQAKGDTKAAIGALAMEWGKISGQTANERAANFNKFMQSRFPGLSVGDAVNLAAQAAKVRVAARKVLADERQAAKDKLDAARAEANRMKKEAGKAQAEFLARIKSLSEPPKSYSERTARVIRLAFISQVPTSIVNVMMAQATRLIEKSADVFDLAFRQVAAKLGVKLDPNGLPVTARYRDILGATGINWNLAQFATGYAASLTKQISLAQTTLADYPLEYNRIANLLNSDIENLPSTKGFAGTGEKGFRAIEWTYEKANFLNSLQEEYLRSLEFNHALQIQLGARGLNYEKLVKDGETDKITEADVEFAVRRALRVTMAKDPDVSTRTGLFAKKTLDAYAQVPSLMSIFIFAFPRFTYNAVSFVTDFLPGFGLAKAAYNRQLFDSRTMANQAVGLTLMLILSQVVAAAGDDEEWWKLKVGTDEQGKPWYLDARKYAPLSSFVYLANKFNRIRNKKPVFSKEDVLDEVLEALAGLTSRNTTDSSFARLINQARISLDSAGTAEAGEKNRTILLQLAAKLAGDTGAAFVNPLVVAKETWAQFDKNERVERDSLNFPLISQFEKKFPGSSYLFDLPVRMDAATNEEKIRPHGIYKILGVRLLDGSREHRPAKERGEILAQDFANDRFDHEYKAKLPDEQRKSDIKYDLRRGILRGMDLTAKIKEYAANNVLTAKEAESLLDYQELAVMEVRAPGSKDVKEISVARFAPFRANVKRLNLTQVADVMEVSSPELRFVLQDIVGSKLRRAWSQNELDPKLSDKFRSFGFDIPTAAPVKRPKKLTERQKEMRERTKDRRSPAFGFSPAQ